MINNVEIIDLKATEIMTGMYTVEGTVRVDATAPPGCIMNPPIAKIVKAGGVQVGAALNTTQEGATNWYRAEFFNTGELVPTDVIYAAATAAWSCPGGDSQDSPGVPVP